MITGLYAGILALLYFRISFATIKARRKHKISVGMGPNNEIAQIVGAHGNFAAYVPLLLVMLFIAESSGRIPSAVIHAFGVAITAGRFFHYEAFRYPDKMNFKLRVWGMQLTLWSLIGLAVMAIGLYLQNIGPIYGAWGVP